MRLNLGRILILLPLVWIFGLAPGLAASEKSHRHGRLPAIDFSTVPVATLATPERSVAVFRLVPPETLEWTYMVVTTDSDGTKVTYGDDLTVGGVIGDLSADLLPAPKLAGRQVASKTKFNLDGPGKHDDNRCAKTSGWHFETSGVRSNTCVEGLESARIERAIDLLDLGPTALAD